MTNHTDVAVVGGGIGGLALALGLARGGKHVRVLERAPAFGEIGAGIQVAPNASRVLDGLGVLAQVHRDAVFPRRMVWRDIADGAALTTLDLDAPFRERYGFPYLVMHRSDLLTALLDACEAEARIELTANAHVTAIDEGDACATAVLADGTRITAAVVVGADGLWSTIRPTIEDDGPPINSAYVAYRGAIPIDEVAGDGDAAFDSVVLWTGHNRHLVQYPVRRGELYNQVAVFRSARFDGGDADVWGTPDEMDAMYAHDAPAVVRAIARVQRDRRWPMYDRLPIARWRRGRVVLLGDAAHPMLQYLAQGACQALEDAAVLANMLIAHDDSDVAIDAYIAEREPRTARVQTLARAWGDWWHLADHASRDARLAARRDDDYADVDWFYGYDAGGMLVR